MEEQMQSVQAHPAIRLPFGNSIWSGLEATLKGVATFIAAILLRRPRMSGHGVPHYEGRAWCDSMEQQVIADLASCRRPGF
jgi:hypothetical protein